MISDNIKQLIDNKGITQIKFCEMLGITKDTFYKQMRSNSLTTNVLERYAKALNVPLWRLFVTPNEVLEYLDKDKESKGNTDSNVIACPYCNQSIKIHIKAEQG